MAQNHSQATSGSLFHCGYFGCNKTFTRRTGARRHETTVHGDKKFCCNEPDCNYRGGKRRNDFNKHMKNKHPGHDDHLFVPDNFSSPQGNQSPVTNTYQSPQIKYSSQVSGDFSQMPSQSNASPEMRFNLVDTHQNPPVPTMGPLASASVPQFHGSIMNPNTISLRPPDTRIFQVVGLPRPEFEPVPAATMAIGNIWGQVNSATIGDSGSSVENMTGAIVEDEYENFDGGYDLNRYGQAGNNSYCRW